MSLNQHGFARICVLNFTPLALASLVARVLTPVPLRLPRPPNTLAHK